MHANESETCSLSPIIGDADAMEAAGKMKKKMAELAKAETLFKDILPELL